MKRDPRRSVPYHVYRIHRRSEAFGREVLAPHGVSKEQLFYLDSLIGDGDGITQEELAGRLAVDKSSAGRMVASLERAGLVRRARVPGDARAYSVRVTARGRRLHERLVPALWEWHRVLCRGLTAAQVRTAIELLERMGRNAEAACCAEDGR